jgi:hypothetical protein
MFRLELDEFQSGKKVSFYHGALKKNLTVYLELLVSMQDQPERRAANYIMLGSSTYTARWGVSLNTMEVACNIPSCKIALKIYSWESTPIKLHVTSALTGIQMMVVMHYCITKLHRTIQWKKPILLAS